MANSSFLRCSFEGCSLIPFFRIACAWRLSCCDAIHLTPVDLSLSLSVIVTISDKCNYQEIGCLTNKPQQIKALPGE